MSLIDILNIPINIYENKINDRVFFKTESVEDIVKIKSLVTN